MVPRILRFVTWVLMASLVLVRSVAGQAEAKEKGATRLPVYKVVQEGATASEGAALARQLGIAAKRIVSEGGGAVEFVDPARYLTLPTESAGETAAKSE